MNTFFVRLLAAIAFLSLSAPLAFPQKVNPSNQIAWGGPVFFSQPGDTLSSIEAACSTACTYVVTAQQTITLSANHTLSSNVSLNFLNGGKWTVNGAFTLTIPNQVQGTLNTHFAGSSAIAFGAKQALAPVEWFGAIGNWNGTTGTDNTAAIQACLNALSVGQCALQAQSYKTTAPLTITRSQVGIVGVAGGGFAAAALYPTPSPSTIIISSAIADVLDVSGTSTSNNVAFNVFTNFTIARTQAPVSAKGISLTFSYGAKIDGVTSMDSTVDFYLHAFGSQGVGYIQNSAALWGFNGFGETSGSFAGIQVDSLDGTPSPSTRILNSFAVANPANVTATTFGIESNGSATADLMIDHFETATVSYGEFLQVSGGLSTDVHILNAINDNCEITCIFVQSSLGAVEVSGGWDFRVSTSTPAIEITASTHVDITNLQIFYPAGTGVGLSVANSDSIRVSHNDLISGSGSAITFDTVRGSTITGNVMNGITATNIISFVNSSGDVISSNTINGTATNGISLDANSSGTGGLETNQIGNPAFGTVTNPIVNLGVNPTTFCCGNQIGLNGSTYQIRQGIRASGSPLCSAAANGNCTFTLTWPKAFPNTTWAGQCSAETSTGAGVITSVAETGKTTTTATVTFHDLSGATNAVSSVICEGWE
jgi:hypothetical protein